MRRQLLTARTPANPRAVAGRRRRAVGRPLAVAAVLVAGWLVPAVAAAADAVKLDKPVRVSTVATDKSKVAGRIVSYDATGFELTDDKGVTTTVKWSALPPAKVMDVYGLLLPKGTAEEWVAAGRVIYHLEGGKDAGEKAFARALRLDSRVKAAVDDARKPPAMAAGGGGGGELVGEAGKVTTREEVLKKLWGPQSEEDQAKAVAELKEFVAKHPKLKNESLKLYETKYFLFFSDLKQDEAKKWAGLLDKMYDRLAELFAVPKGSNIWRGKCLIFVFAKPEDYHDHEAKTYRTDSKGSAGMCHSFGNGFVHVAFYRQPEELQFAHVLVHESVHGFIHRYRSHVYIPNWANEGLAEVIASELVPQKARATDSKFRAAQGVRENDGVGGNFYSARNIEAWQYPVAEQLAAFMIAQNKKGYVAFINAVKDGVLADEALTKHFGASRDRLTAAYIESLGIKKKGK
ncbi:MAG: hypothetical protein AVDCRST_MAG64-2763 [uncultured Phycisphaerae bacterium]|uniref:DUF1570 domain-containing protein n=1 Tax=uncultured Phycisphaerae bacterium TaxID=904963 RepID=A0A6J4PKS3_9BACT|nr:MAG: hypothetical protein AVDCRST_MAG64-2763 [uncultured Phycisphaerae bacterium]